MKLVTITFEATITVFSDVKANDYFNHKNTEEFVEDVKMNLPVVKGIIRKNLEGKLIGAKNNIKLNDISFGEIITNNKSNE